MKRLLQYTRRPDISFSRDGTIRVSARVVRSLGLRPGDSINIAVDGGEYLLHAVTHHGATGRFEASCHPTKKGSNNYRARSVRLCRALLDSVGESSFRVAYAVGDAVIRSGYIYLPLITRNPLS